MTYLDARAVCLALSSFPSVVHFIKRDGTARRMLTVPPAEGTRERTARDGSRLVTVFDAETGALRQVNASRTLSVRPMRARRHEATRTRQTAAEIVAEMFD